MTVGLRAAAPSDAAAVARIYNEGIEDRVATFETRLRSTDDMAGRIAAEPMIVAERDGVVAGFASWMPYSDREAYAGIGEYTVYVAREARGEGIGSALIERLVAEAQARGMWKLMSRIFPENAASLALAQRHGFREVGVHRRHSRLDGAWRDIIVVELLIGGAAD